MHSKYFGRKIALLINCINLIIAILYGAAHKFSEITANNFVDFLVPISIAISLFLIYIYLLIPPIYSRRIGDDRDDKLVRSPEFAISIFYPLYIIFGLSQTLKPNPPYSPNGFSCSSQVELWMVKGQAINCAFSDHLVIYAYIVGIVVMGSIFWTYRKPDRA